MSERTKDLPQAVPERAKQPRDATIAVPVHGLVPTSQPPSFVPSSASVDSISPLPLDSYQPPNTGTIAAPSSQRELIVPSAATVGSILEHVRQPSADRLEIEARLDAGGMGRIDVAIDRALDRRIAL